MADQRQSVDDLIKDLRDTIEFDLRNEEPSSLRRKARDWGVVYNEDDEAELPTTPRFCRTVFRCTACEGGEKSRLDKPSAPDSDCRSY